MTDSLTYLRRRFGFLLRYVFWLHVPLFGLVAALTGAMPVATALALGVTMAVIYHVTWRRNGPAPATRYLSAVLLVFQPSLFVMLLQGHPWQMDMHMYFFAMIALNIAWFDRVALVVAATTTALHHLVLLYFIPLAVFASDGNLARVVLHALIVVFQTLVLVWVSGKVTGSFRRIEGMRAELVAKGETLKDRTFEAEQANRARGMFLANMSHEIRTPINAIIGFCHLLQKETLEPRQRDRIAKISAAGTSLLRLVNDILDLSKNEAGQLILEEIVFDPRLELSRQVEMLSEPVHRKNLRIVTQIDPDLPALLVGDATRLNQIFVNLLGNAIKFTDQGTIMIAMRMTGRTGDIALIETTISDDGIGMTQDQLSRMFTPFTQADSSITRRFGGTGLGLAICRQIVEQMGGSIGAQSAPGQGSTFTVTTPLRIASQHARSPSVPNSRIRNLRILLVDDNPIVRQIMQEIFLRWGMAVEIADSGSSALSLVRRAVQGGCPHDLIIMDWKMPGMDGLQTLQAIQSIMGKARTPTVFMMTSYDIDDLRQQTIGKGISRFLGKPINADSLLDALNQLVSKGAETGRDVAASPHPAAAPRFTGQRILLVEDNEINRQIALEILSDAGLAVDCATNGAVACRMIQDTDGGYAAVLMDIQMPEMDGITATRIIRQSWPTDRLPVIAMTAYAFVEERKQCLDAGMNDHLAKPIDPARLLGTLARWMQPAASGAPVAAASGLQILPGVLPPFDIAAALRRVNGKEMLLLRLILSFSDSYASFSSDLMRLTGSGRHDEAHRLAHSLKGVAASLELAGVAEIAGRIEQSLAGGDDGPVPGLLAELAPQLGQAIAAAQTLKDRAAVEPAVPAPGQPVDAGALADARASLHDQIRRRSLSARQGFARLADAMQLDDAARISHPLNLALQRLDYAAALALMDRDAAPAAENLT